MTPWTLPFPAGAALIAAQAAQLPRFETGRLVLRAPRIEDWEVLERCWFETGDGDAPQSPEDAWLDFNQIVASWLLRGYGPLTICDHGGTVLGLVSLNLEFGDAEPEIGWVLVPEARGKGLATEAAGAVMPWLDRLMGVGGYVSYVDPANAASDRVARRLGGRRDPAAERGFAEPVHVWRYGARA